MTLGKKGVAGPGTDEFDAPTEVGDRAERRHLRRRRPHRRRHGDRQRAHREVRQERQVHQDVGQERAWAPASSTSPHTLAFDSRGRLFVGDRQNNRIQIFDQDGKFIAQWFQFGRPSGIYIDKKTDTLYVADSESRDGRTNIGQLALAADRLRLQPGHPARHPHRQRARRLGEVSSFPIRVRIRTPAARAWRKASRSMPRETSTARTS